MIQFAEHVGTKCLRWFPPFFLFLVPARTFALYDITLGKFDACFVEQEASRIIAVVNDCCHLKRFYFFEIFCGLRVIQLTCLKQF